MIYLGDFLASQTITFPIQTRAKTGAAVAPASALEAADLVIYKGSSATQRSSAAGVTMTSPFDSITGGHMVAIDLTDNTDAGFWAAGNDYHVWLVPDETVDSETIREPLVSFSVENRAGPLMRRRNTAQAGGANTITLDASASNYDCCPGDLIYLRRGTGAGQSNTVSAFDNTSKVATMVNDWPAAQPDSTSVFEIHKTGGIVFTDADELATAASVQSLAADFDDRLPPSLDDGRMVVDVKAVNGIEVGGSGTEDDPWGPA